MTTNSLDLLLSITTTGFFVLLIVWIQASIFKRQREFEIKKDEYREITERLVNIGKRCSGILSIRDVRGLGLYEESFKEQIARYKKDREIRLKAHTDSIQFFPERHILDISINNSFRQRLDAIEYPEISKHKELTKIEELEKSSDIGLSIMRELIKIRRRMATDILNGEIKEKDHNKEYLNRVYKLLEQNKIRENYEDIHTKRKRFEEFKSIINNGQG